MTFKTIGVHLDAGPHCAKRVDLAITVAARHGAHLVGLAPTGVPDVLMTLSSAVPDGVEFIALSARFLRERAEAAVADFVERARAAGVASHEARVVVDEPVDAIVRLARCSDLLVIGQTDRHASPDGVAWDFPQQTVLNSGCPLLVVPYAGRFDAVGERVLVAWKGTREAVRAVRDALPLLRAAERVVLIEVADAAPPTDAARVALLEVQGWLSRHGVESEVRLESGAAEAGDVLLSRAADHGSDLIVMGAYGHSRMREWVLGGVTRHLLDHMTVPTLMSH
jgi:nucleotide-binding universal stress UspA family protein